MLSAVKVTIKKSAVPAEALWRMSACARDKTAELDLSAIQVPGGLTSEQLEWIMCELYAREAWRHVTRVNLSGNWALRRVDCLRFFRGLRVINVSGTRVRDMHALDHMPLLRRIEWKRRVEDAPRRPVTYVGAIQVTFSAPRQQCI